MKFGVREIANVVFKAKNTQKIGPYTFYKGQPVFYIDTAKTSTLEGAATSVYATGGQGNTRLIAWQGEKTLTFTVEDALLSPTSFAMLSGAGLLKSVDDSSGVINQVHFHQTTRAIAAEVAMTGSNRNLEIDLTDALEPGEQICSVAPIYIMKMDNYGDLTGEILSGWSVSSPDGKKLQYTTNVATNVEKNSGPVMVDYYVIKRASAVSELQIDANNFAGYYYVEADTLFRRQSDGKDLPANITLPNVKIQSNFTFSMASTGDPSTFTFTMDAFPGYTYFNRTKKVLCAMQIVDDATESTEIEKSVFPHPTGFNIEESAAAVGGSVNSTIGDSVNGQDLANESDAHPGYLKQLSIIQNPKKTVYTVGDKLDLTGLKVEAIYQDGSRRIVSPADKDLPANGKVTIEPAHGDVLKASDTLVAVEYSYGYGMLLNTSGTNFPITVNAATGD